MNLFSNWLYGHYIKYYIKNRELLAKSDHYKSSPIGILYVSDLLTLMTQRHHVVLQNSSLSSGSNAPHQTTGCPQDSKKAKK